jgi:hypothetical protein
MRHFGLVVWWSGGYAIVYGITIKAPDHKTTNLTTSKRLKVS